MVLDFVEASEDEVVALELLKDLVENVRHFAIIWIVIDQALYQLVVHQLLQIWMIIEELARSVVDRIADGFHEPFSFCFWRLVVFLIA